MSTCNRCGALVYGAPHTCRAPSRWQERTATRPSGRAPQADRHVPDADHAPAVPGGLFDERWFDPASVDPPRPALGRSRSKQSPYGDAAISVRGITKTFGEADVAVAAVRGVDFEVQTGEVVLIMGPSGSGKTTLLLILGAMLRPTAGSVVIGGTEISRVSERQLPGVRARHLGFVFQDFNLLGALTARENVEMACNLAGIRGAVAGARATELLHRVGLGQRVNFRPEKLSGGEKQRVAIARALANNPPLLLCDEPTANLDSQHGRSIGALLRRLADEDGRTCLIVTHDERLTEIADRVLWLEDGQIHVTGHPHEHSGHRVQTHAPVPMRETV